MTERPLVDGLDAELLDRYLAGECAEADAAAVRRHLMAHPEAARAVEQLLHALDSGAATTAASPTAPNTERAWRRLRERMRTSERAASEPGAGVVVRRPSGTPVSRPPAAPGTTRATPSVEWPVELPRVSVRSAAPPHWRRALVTLAASVLVMAGVGYGVSQRDAPHDDGSPDATAVAAVAARTYATAPRERAELRLPDGTRVRLAPMSRLRVGTDFGDERRDVFLDGEGYFEVTHDARRPFTVFAGSASVRDLGTTFAVRSYPDDSATQVVVREGRVALSGVGALAAGERGRLTADGVGTRGRVDVETALGWLHGRLVFARAPLGQVLQELRRWHDVEATVADPALLTLPFTGTLTDASPDDAVARLAAALALDVRRDGARVVLRARAVGTPALTP